MNSNNLPIGAENDPYAPYNTIHLDLYCSECGTDKMQWHDGGVVNRVEWNAYKCFDCGNIMSDEPCIDD